MPALHCRQAPFKPFAEMDQRFFQEFQQSAKQLFPEFEEEPMAAASLAQVLPAVALEGGVFAEAGTRGAGRRHRATGARG